MRKLISLILIITSVFLLCACGMQKTPTIDAKSPIKEEENSTAAVEKPAEPEEPVSKGTIGIMISSMDSKFNLDIEKGIEDTLRENGYEVILMDAKGTDVNEVYHMQDMLKKDIKGIVYNPVSTLVALDIVRLAVTKGIPVVSVGKVSGEARVVSNVTTDYYSLGAKTATMISEKFLDDYVEIAEIPAMEKTDEKTKYLEGFHSVMDTIYNFRVYNPVLLQGIEPTTELYIAEAFRHNSRIKALITTSDEDALKAIEISKEEEFVCKNITGLGGDEKAIEATKNGDMLVTYKLYPEKMGIAAANAMIDYLDGKTVESEILIDADIITSPTASDVEGTVFQIA